MLGHFQSEIFRFPAPYHMFGGKPNGLMTREDAAKLSPLTPPEEVDAIRLDAFGFRNDHDVTAPKEPGEVRVFVVGGSTTFMGSSNSNTIPGQLERLFQAHDHFNVTCYNFGIISQCSTQQLVLTCTKLLDFQPDIIVTYDGINELIGHYGFDPRVGNPYNFFFMESVLNAVRIKDQGGQSVLEFGQMNWRLPELREQVKYLSPEWRMAIVRNYINNIRKMKQITASFDIGYVSFIQPMIYHKSPLVGKEIAFAEERSYYSTHGEYYANVIEHAKSIDGASEDQKYIFDVTRVFRDFPHEVYWDFAHTSDRGNQEIAKAIYPHVQRKLQIMGKLH